MCCFNLKMIQLEVLFKLKSGYPFSEFQSQNDPIRSSNLKKGQDDIISFNLKMIQLEAVQQTEEKR